MVNVQVEPVLGPWLAELGRQLDATVWDRLETLVGLWERYAAAFNLVGDASRPALIEHVREGLMAVLTAERAGADAGTWVDIGSGAGIPGLVVGAVRGHVVLVEPRERRAAFLELAIGALKVPESTVIRARAGATTWENMQRAEQFDMKNARFEIASAKAVMEVNRWISVASWLAPRGIIICHVTKSVSEMLGPRVIASVEHGVRVVVAVAGPERGGEAPILGGPI